MAETSASGQAEGTVRTTRETLSVERVVHASPAAIFDLLADPSRHPDIDGSGALREPKPGSPSRLSLGARFGMSMRIGLPYSMVSEVVEFEEDRRIAWQSKPPGVFGRLGGGRIWRYELEEVEGGTRVTETWDLTKDKQKSFLRRGPVPRSTREAMERTLDRIQQLLAPEP